MTAVRSSSRRRSPAGAAAPSSRRTTSRPRPGSRSCGPAGPRSTRRSRRTPSLAVVVPGGCGIGGDAFWLVWDEARTRQHALNGSGGRRRRPTRPRSARGRTATPPAARAVDDHRPGRGPVVGRRPRAVRPAVAGAGPRPGDRAGPDAGSRRGTGSSARSRRRRRGSSAAIGSGSGFDAGLPAARPAVAAGRARPAPALATTLETPRRRRVRRLLRRRPRAATGARARGRRVAHHVDRPRRPHLDVGRARSRPTTAASASRPTRRTRRGRRARAPQRPRAVRAAAAGRVRSGGRGPTPRWIHLGIEAAKLAMADRDAYLTDPTFRDDPVDRLLSKDHAAALADRIDPRRAPPPRRRDRSRRVGGTIYLGVGRRRGQRGQPHPVELHRLRVRRRRSRDRHPLPEPRLATSASTRPTRTSSRPASGRCTRCCPGCCSARASAGRGS